VHHNFAMSVGNAKEFLPHIIGLASSFPSALVCIVKDWPCFLHNRLGLPVSYLPAAPSLSIYQRNNELFTTDAFLRACLHVLNYFMLL